MAGSSYILGNRRIQTLCTFISRLVLSTSTAYSSTSTRKGSEVAVPHLSFSGYLMLTTYLIPTDTFI
jgi:hypothetical protein